MPNASWAIGSFLGGEISKYAQGRFDKPDYHTSLKVCLNSFPVEAGTWVRRPGSMYASHTRSGVKGRVIKFDFSQASAVSMEFTDGWLRFRNGAALITTNDPETAVTVSTANPAVVQTIAPHGWSTGNTVIFSNQPGPAPLLENRQFLITVVDATHFSLADALTGANIDGSTLGTILPNRQVSRVHELTTSYVGGIWSGLRAIQAEQTDIFLTATIAPQILTVTTQPTALANAQFALNPLIFNDGPYLDPFTNGVQVTPSGTSGIVALTLSFAAYDSTKAYAKGAFVTSGGTNYVSLIDQNLNNTPGVVFSAWQSTSAGAAVNNGQGFLGTDVGRLVRMYSEPGAWSTLVTYSTTSIVSYNPSGVPGASTYWQSLTNSNTGNAPGADLTHWQIIPQGAALWTWGKIASLLNVINPQLPGSVPIGNLTQNGGLSSAFDGQFTKGSGNCARLQSSGSGGSWNSGTIFLLDTFVGKNFGSSPQKIASATVYPTVDESFGKGVYSTVFSATQPPQSLLFNYSFTLRGKQTAPSGPSDGTALGFVGPVSSALAVSIVSNDQSTSWNYVWVELLLTAQVPGPNITANAYVLDCDIAQVSFFSPTGVTTSSGVNVEILGPALLYNNPILTWRLGAYSNTTGYPTCGIYNDGRLYLGGAIGNRFDASVSNGISGSVINFAPTDAYGVVAASAAISYTFNSDGVNPILGMKPDLQGVLMFTQAGEWLVQAPTAGPISPSNISARNVTHHGSANILPISTEHTTVFVQRFARKLLEYFPDVYSGKFSAPNLADKAQHLTSNGLAELAYTSAVTPIIWARDALGKLLGITYQRNTLSTSTGPTFYAWHHHALGSGRIVESITAGPSVGGNLDSLTMVTNDATTNIRHVEVLTDTQDELSTFANSWFLDDAVVPTSTIQTGTGLTINGLWHLNGKTVQVFAGGLDCGDPGEGKPFSDFVVSNGSITITYGDGVSAGPGRGLFTAAFVATNPQIVVGFTYNSDGHTVKLMTQAESGARNGPAFAKISRGHRFGMKLVNTKGLSVGGDLSKPLFNCDFKLGDGVTSIPVTSSFTGVHQDALRDDYEYETGTVAWRIARPFPGSIVIVGSNLATQDQ